MQGFVTTLGGAAIGFAVGQAFDGTVVPLTAGFFGCGLAALAIVLATERGRLFRAQQPTPTDVAAEPQNRRATSPG